MLPSFNCNDFFMLTKIAYKLFKNYIFNWIEIKINANRPNILIHNKKKREVTLIEIGFISPDRLFIVGMEGGGGSANMIYSQINLGLKTTAKQK